MSGFKKAGAAVLMAAAVSACTNLANYTSVHRTPDINSGRSVVMDNEQSGVFVTHRFDRYPTRLNSDGTPAEYEYRRAVSYCLQPPPDAIAAESASASVVGELIGRGGGQAAGAAGQGVAGIGLRTQSIQLLRDAFYRLCEGYANNGIDGYEYGLLQRRFQSNMLAILAIEQLTGAVTGPAAAVGGSGEARLGTAVANLAASNAEMRSTKAELETRRDALKAEKTEAQNAAADDTSHRDEAEIQAEINLVEAQISDYERSIKVNEGVLERAQEGEAEAIALISAPAAAAPQSTINPQTAQVVSETVRDITLRTISQNYMPQMCVEMLRLNNAMRPEMDAICQEYLEGYTSSLIERMATIDQALARVLADESLTAEQRLALVAAIRDLAQDDGQRAMMSSLQPDGGELAGASPD